MTPDEYAFLGSMFFILAIVVTLRLLWSEVHTPYIGDDFWSDEDDADGRWAA